MRAHRPNTAFPQVFYRERHAPRHNLRDVATARVHKGRDPASNNTQCSLVNWENRITAESQNRRGVWWRYNEAPRDEVELSVLETVVKERVEALNALELIDAARTRVREKRIAELTAEGGEEETNVCNVLEEKGGDVASTSTDHDPDTSTVSVEPIGPVLYIEKLNCSSSTVADEKGFESNEMIDRISHFGLRIAIADHARQSKGKDILVSGSHDTLVTWFIRNECQLFAKRVMRASFSEFNLFLKEHPLVREHHVSVLADFDCDQQLKQDLLTAAEYFSKTSQSDLSTFSSNSRKILVLPWISNPRFPAHLIANRINTVVVCGYILMPKHFYVASCLIPNFAQLLKSSLQSDLHMLLHSNAKRSVNERDSLYEGRQQNVSNIGVYDQIQRISRCCLSFAKPGLKSKDGNIQIKGEDKNRIRPISWSPPSFFTPVWLLALTKVIDTEVDQLQTVSLLGDPIMEEASIQLLREEIWSDEFLGEDLFKIQQRMQQRRVLHSKQCVQHVQNDSTQVVKRFKRHPPSHSNSIASTKELAGIHPEEVEDVIEDLFELFPPCMLYMYNSLHRDRHLKHYGRVQLALFLKDLGLPLQSSLVWWRRRLLRKGFSPENEYNILHHYGQLGRGEEYRTYDCYDMCSSRAHQDETSHSSSMSSSSLSSSSPSFSSSSSSEALSFSVSHTTAKHGCPFTHLPLEDLSDLLEPSLIKAAMHSQSSWDSAKERLMKVMAEAARVREEIPGSDQSKMQAMRACKEYLRQCQNDPSSFPDEGHGDGVLNSRSGAEIDAIGVEGGQKLSFVTPVEWVEKRLFWKRHIKQFRHIQLEEADEDDSEYEPW